MGKLCISRATCYLALDTKFIDDMNGNNIVSISAKAPVSSLRLPAKFVSDDTGPVLKTALLNLQGNKLTLVWDEVVQSSDLNAKLITLRADQKSTGVKVVLSDSKSTSVIGTSVVVTLTVTDQNAIKAAKLGSLAF